MSHSQCDPYNTDHMRTTDFALTCRMIAQAWGHNPGEKVLGAPQLYLFEPHQTEQMGGNQIRLDITEVWDQKRAAMECNEGQIHLWDYYTALHSNVQYFKRNSGGQAGGRDCKYQKGSNPSFREPLMNYGADMSIPTNPSFDVAHLGHVEVYSDKFDESLDFFTGLWLETLGHG